MFEEFVNPSGKKKGKDKDVGKRRAYVRVVTSLGGGSLNLELYCEKVCLNGTTNHGTQTGFIIGPKNMLQLSNASESREVR